MNICLYLLDHFRQHLEPFIYLSLFLACQFQFYLTGDWRVLILHLKRNVIIVVNLTPTTPLLSFEFSIAASLKSKREAYRFGFSGNKDPTSVRVVAKSWR